MLTADTDEANRQIERVFALWSKAVGLLGIRISVFRFGASVSLAFPV
jgi:hypothetical protein